MLRKGQAFQAHQPPASPKKEPLDLLSSSQWHPLAVGPIGASLQHCVCPCCCCPVCWAHHLAVGSALLGPACSLPSKVCPQGVLPAAPRVSTRLRLGQPASPPVVGPFSLPGAIAGPARWVAASYMPGPATIGCLVLSSGPTRCCLLSYRDGSSKRGRWVGPHLGTWPGVGTWPLKASARSPASWGNPPLASLRVGPS